jgi:hypothetical protein
MCPPCIRGASLGGMLVVSPPMCSQRRGLTQNPMSPASAPAHGNQPLGQGPLPSPPTVSQANHCKPRVAQAPPPLPPTEVSSKACVMNERHRTAKRAQKDCSDLYLLLLLHSQPHVEAATVYGFRGSALLVFVPKYHLKVRAPPTSCCPVLCTVSDAVLQRVGAGCPVFWACAFCAPGPAPTDK